MAGCQGNRPVPLSKCPINGSPLLMHTQQAAEGACCAGQQPRAGMGWALAPSSTCLGAHKRNPFLSPSGAAPSPSRARNWGSQLSQVSCSPSVLHWDVSDRGAQSSWLWLEAKSLWESRLDAVLNPRVNSSKLKPR